MLQLEPYSLSQCKKVSKKMGAGIYHIISACNDAIASVSIRILDGKCHPHWRNNEKMIFETCKKVENALI